MALGTNTHRGANYTIIASNTPAAIKVGHGVVHRLIVTSAITGTITINDNATAASGPLLYTSAANPAVGSVLEVGAPFTLGAWIVPGSAGTINAVYD